MENGVKNVLTGVRVLKVKHYIIFSVMKYVLGNFWIVFVLKVRNLFNEGRQIRKNCQLKDGLQWLPFKALMIYRCYPDDISLKLVIN